MHGSTATFGQRLLKWYDRHRRDLPWRVPLGHAGSPDPYLVFVSEAMLQQTQVATVIPYFHRFIQRFPSFDALARADEQDVLRLWQGLGYYSRARNLQAAAKRVIESHAGELPRSAQDLQLLPGVGRYTAGAVASIAFDCRAPILDGNVIRVLCRLDRIETDPRDKPTQVRLWARAKEILPARRCGDFNSALMELGATVCTPRQPKCLLCPVREHCEAQSAGVQERIPPPRKAKETPLLRRQVLCVRRDDRYLIERRPAQGRWAGMWQFVTMAQDQRPTVALSRKHLGFELTKPAPIGEVTHGLTHRRYEFDVFACDAVGEVPDVAPRRWVTLAEIDAYPLPRPHVKVLGMLRDRDAATGVAAGRRGRPAASPAPSRTNRGRAASAASPRRS
jgi:A/G-specific adenine glycosylase